MSLKPVGGRVPSHLGHKTLGKKVCYCQNLPSNFVLLGSSYSLAIVWSTIPPRYSRWPQLYLKSQIFHSKLPPFDCCKRGYVVLGVHNSSYIWTQRGEGSTKRFELCDRITLIQIEMACYMKWHSSSIIYSSIMFSQGVRHPNPRAITYELFSCN